MAEASLLPRSQRYCVYIYRYPVPDRHSRLPRHLLPTASEKKRTKENKGNRSTKEIEAQRKIHSTAGPARHLLPHYPPLLPWGPQRYHAAHSCLARSRVPPPSPSPSTAAWPRGPSGVSTRTPPSRPPTLSRPGGPTPGDGATAACHCRTSTHSSVPILWIPYHTSSTPPEARPKPRTSRPPSTEPSIDRAPPRPKSTGSVSTRPAAF